MGNNWLEKQNKEEYIDKIRNEFTPEQFRREYLCEPKIKSLPSIVEFQNGERLEWQPSSKREVEEYIKRCNLQPYIQEPDGNGIAILKLPSLLPEQIKKFKEEWQRFVNTSQPITSVATFNPIVEHSEMNPKELETYLKKYGTSKIHTWSYRADA